MCINDSRRLKAFFLIPSEFLIVLHVNSDGKTLQISNSNSTVSSFIWIRTRLEYRAFNKFVDTLFFILIYHKLPSFVQIEKKRTEH